MEKEYIERKMLIDILNEKAEMAQGTPKQVFCSACTIIGLLPTADVVEVVHGEWLETNGKNQKGAVGVM